MKKSKLVHSILLYILVLFLTLAIFSTKWALKTFAFLSFDETLFQLTSPIKSAETSILTSYLTDSLLVSIPISIIIFFMLYKLFNYLNKDKPTTKIKTIKLIMTIIITISSIGIVYTCLDKIGFITFLYNQTHRSSYIEENYVDPSKVKITFPENKKNLIYIYVESLESTYFSKKVGGETSSNLLKPITKLTQENVNFSDTNKLGGAISVPGTTWTTSAMVAQTAGLPLKMNFDFILNSKHDTMLNGATTLGDILANNGYKQMYMIGSDKEFGHRGAYFKKHGNYEIYDYNTAKEKGKIDDDYYVWWGYEDSKLFEYAKEEITNLAKDNQPFNFTMLTTNTHFTDGYLEKNCSSDYENAYFNAIHCSAGQLEEFINWIKKQPFYENTTIIMTGDHISMSQNIYKNNAPRRVYNVFINSAVSPNKEKNRKFSTIDFFPTTIASLGAEIEGNRLGLGTNLFSNQKTYIEEIGIKKFNKEVSKHSSFYDKKILNLKK